MKHTGFIMRNIYAILVGAGIALGVPNGALSADEQVGIGTLRCTLGPGAVEAVQEPRAISCLFKPDNGVAARYDGVLRKVGDPAPTMDKLVLLWAVFASDKSIAVRELEGTYVGTIDDETGQPQRPLGALTGGPDSNIELRPFTRVPDTDDETPLVLELELKSTRV